MSNQIIVLSICHTNTLGLVRSIGEGGFHPILVEVNTSSEPSFVKASKYIKEYHRVDTPEDGVNLILEKYASPEDKSIILTGADSCAMAIDNNFNRLSPFFIISSINKTQGRLSEMMNKETIRKFADSQGLVTPRSWVIDCSAGINLPEDIKYPCVIKAINSVVGRKDVKIYDNQADLCNGISDLILQSPIIQIQEYIKKDFEILINGCILSNGEIITSCALKKIRHYPDEFGGLAYGIVTPKIENYISMPSLHRFLKSLNYYGLFSVEYIFKDGNSYFLEINLRNDGTSYISTYGGVNLPLIWVRDALGLENKHSDRVRNEFLSSSAIVDFHHVTAHRISLFKWLKEITHSKVDLLWNRKDIKPFIRHITNYVTRKS